MMRCIDLESGKSGRGARKGPRWRIDEPTPMGGLTSVELAAALTRAADKGPKATAVKTEGKNETEVSMFRVTGTLCLSASAAMPPRPTRIHHRGRASDELTRSSMTIAALAHRRTIQTRTF